MKALWSVTLILFAVSTAQALAPNALYKPVLHKLKSRTHIPILLPAWLPPDDSGPRFPQVSADRHSYSVDLAYAQDCNGAQACTGTTISGEDLAAAGRSARTASRYGTSETTMQYLRQRYESGRRVGLKRGVFGYFSRPGRSADGGSTTLTWQYHSVYYSLQMRGGAPMATMVRCAASALP